jgi:hypothetical protein
LPLVGNLDLDVTEISNFAVAQAGWISPANRIRPSDLNKHWHSALVYQKQKLAAHVRGISNPWKIGPSWPIESEVISTITQVCPSARFGTKELYRFGPG